MNRNEHQERIDFCKRELEWLIKQPTNCTTCTLFDGTATVCKRFGPVPAEFIAQGCDEWDFDDVPF